MPITPVDYRAACGRHEKQSWHSVSPTTTQEKANHIAASQGQKTASQLNALSVLYLTGLVLPVLQQVSLSQINPHSKCDNQDNAIAASSAKPVQHGLSCALSAVSFSPPVAGSLHPRHCSVTKVQGHVEKGVKKNSRVL